MHSVLDFFSIDSVSTELDATAAPVMKAINERIAGGTSLDEVMNLVFDETRDLCPCDRLGLAFIEDDSRVVARWSRATYTPLVLRVGYGEGFSGSSLERVLKEKKIRLIYDLAAYLEEHPNSQSSRMLVEEGIRSSMTCPLYVDDRPVALFFRSSKIPNAYSDVHLHRHAALANRLAQAVEKVWRIEQLEEANRSYMELLGFVSHELKGPLGTMLMSAESLRDGYLGALDEKQHDAAERLTRKTEYLINLVKDYLDLARMESGRLEPDFSTDVDFCGQVVRPALDVVCEQGEQKSIRMEVKCETLPNMQADIGLLKILVVNLLSNAIKYGNEGGLVRVEVASERGQVVCRIWNEGPGFPPEQKGRLFRKFSRLQTPELLERKGTGVGLYTCWQIAQLHDGHIEADSEPGSWACFTLRLPAFNRPTTG